MILPNKRNDIDTIVENLPIIFIGNITGIGSMNPWNQAATPLYLNSVIWIKTHVINANSNVTLRFAVGDDKPNNEHVLLINIYTHNTRIYGVNFAALSLPVFVVTVFYTISTPANTAA